MCCVVLLDDVSKKEEVGRYNSVVQARVRRVKVQLTRVQILFFAIAAAAIERAARYSCCFFFFLQVHVKNILEYDAALSHVIDPTHGPLST
jgi:hypothetical protein